MSKERIPIEQFNYPLYRGESGINFDGLCIGDELIITGESGEEYGFRAGGDFLSIRPMKYRTGSSPPYILFAMADELSENQSGYAVRFNVRNPDRRYLDLWPGEFVRYSYQYFTALKKSSPTILAGIWDLRGSVNYRQFRRSLKSGLTPYEAALKTWTGRQFSKLGYSAINKLMYKNTEGRWFSKVYAEFVRPE